MTRKRAPYTPRQIEFKLRRRSLNLTQDALAAQLGVASSTIARWENSPSSTIPRLAWLALAGLEASHAV